VIVDRCRTDRRPRHPSVSGHAMPTTSRGPDCAASAGTESEPEA
jgi:hypothetical protein